MESPLEIMEKATQKLFHPDPRRRFEGAVEPMAVANGMGPDKTQEAVALLSNLASNTETFVRWNVAIAPGKVGHESGVGVLKKMVQNERACEEGGNGLWPADDWADSLVVMSLERTVGEL
jgi:HEAT repeat protein